MTLRSITQDHTGLHDITQCYTTLRSITQDHTGLHDITQRYRRYVALHKITLVYMTLHSITRTFLMEAVLSTGRSKEEERSCSGLRLNSWPFWKGDREREREREELNWIVRCGANPGFLIQTLSHTFWKLESPGLRLWGRRTSLVSRLSPQKRFEERTWRRG